MTFPYPHATVAEKDKQFGFYMGSKLERRFPIRRDSAGYVPVAIKDAPAPIAPRDPCFRCGVRGDVGCVHHPLEIAA